MCLTPVQRARLWVGFEEAKLCSRFCSSSSSNGPYPGTRHSCTLALAPLHARKETAPTAAQRGAPRTHRLAGRLPDRGRRDDEPVLDAGLRTRVMMSHDVTRLPAEHQAPLQKAGVAAEAPSAHVGTRGATAPRARPHARATGGSGGRGLAAGLRASRGALTFLPALMMASTLSLNLSGGVYALLRTESRCAGVEACAPARKDKGACLHPRGS